MQRTLTRPISLAVVAVVVAGIWSLAIPHPTAASRSAAVNSKVKPCAVVQRGPEGQNPLKAEKLGLSAREIARLKAKHKTFRVATFWQQVTPGNTTLMIAGLKNTFKKYGLPIKVTAVASADWDAVKQTDQINTLVNTKPNAMVGILVDQKATAGAVKNVMRHHIPLVMWDVDAQGAYPTSIVTSNGRLAGCRAADAMAKFIHGSGKIASMPMKIKFYPTDQRVAGFNERIAKAYPKIHIVARDGATVFADGQQAGEGILQRVPDIKGVFASWQDPAMGVVSAAKTLGRNNLTVTSVDMAPPINLEIAKCGLVKATVPQLPYDEGAAEAKLVAKSILKEKLPKYVVTNTPLVTHKNLLQVYPKVFHEPVPSNLRGAYVHRNCG